MPRLKKKWIQPTPITEKLTAVPETNITPTFLNIEQASAYLGVTTWTIRRLIENKELACAKIGKRFIVKREDLDMVWEKKAEKAA
jgi:excisionase family DNA binding protein